MASNEVSDSFGLFFGLWFWAPIDICTWILGVQKSCSGHGWMRWQSAPHQKSSCLFWHGLTKCFKNFHLPGFQGCLSVSGVHSLCRPTLYTQLRMWQTQPTGIFLTLFILSLFPRVIGIIHQKQLRAWSQIDPSSSSTHSNLLGTGVNYLFWVWVSSTHLSRQHSLRGSYYYRNYYGRIKLKAEVVFSTKLGKEKFMNWGSGNFSFNICNDEFVFV